MQKETKNIREKIFFMENIPLTDFFSGQEVVTQ